MTTPSAPRISEDELARLEELAGKATPGPWAGCAHVAGTDTDCPCRYRGDVVSKATDEVLLQMRVGPDEYPGSPEDDSWRGVKTTTPEQGYADGRYIAALSPDVVLRLIAAARSAPAAGLDAERLARIEHAARDVDGLWDAKDGKPIRWQVEAGEALEDLRTALRESKP